MAAAAATGPAAGVAGLAAARNRDGERMASLREGSPAVNISTRFWALLSSASCWRRASGLFSSLFIVEEELAHFVSDFALILCEELESSGLRPGR